MIEDMWNYLMIYQDTRGGIDGIESVTRYLVIIEENVINVGCKLRRYQGRV